MGFWLWVGISVLTIPAVAFGLVFAALYLLASSHLIERGPIKEGRQRPRSMWWGWFW